jgi:hypothetical protein
MVSEQLVKARLKVLHVHAFSVALTHGAGVIDLLL